ncbi:unnamed protein product, partial [marine sediment metagenome]
IVESGSTDNTYQIAKKLIENYKNQEPSLKLLREETRKGKASAINLAKKYAKGEIVLVTDANSVFDKNVLKEIMPLFKDLEVGAVGGRYCVTNLENSLAYSESFYWDIEYIMRKGESHLDSACTFHGEINAWRKDLVTVDTTMLTEDLDIAMQIKQAGYKVDYEPNAIVYEPSALLAKDQIKQRKRTSIGTLQCIFKHLNYLLLPHDLYNLLIFPSHKALPMFFPFILLAILILYIVTWNVKIMITYFALTLLILVGMFALLIFLKSRLTKSKRIKSSFLISSTPKIVYYVLLNGYLILLAWRDFIFRRYSVLWEKVESTRE